jgi:hypothetical protein
LPQLTKVACPSYWLRNQRSTTRFPMSRSTSTFVISSLFASPASRRWVSRPRSFVGSRSTELHDHKQMVGRPDCLMIIRAPPMTSFMLCSHLAHVASTYDSASDSVVLSTVPDRMTCRVPRRVRGASLPNVVVKFCSESFQFFKDEVIARLIVDSE